MQAIAWVQSFCTLCNPTHHPAQREKVRARTCSPANPGYQFWLRGDSFLSECGGMRDAPLGSGLETLLTLAHFSTKRNYWYGLESNGSHEGYESVAQGKGDLRRSWMKLSRVPPVRLKCLFLFTTHPPCMVRMFSVQ